MPRLQVLNGKRQGALFDVPPGGDLVIGHRPTADLTIEDPWVSWDHARLSWGGDGTCWIEDLGSTNGTYVNCVRIKRETLRHEDIVFLGKTHVIFLSPAEEQLPATPDEELPTLGYDGGFPPAVADGARGPGSSGAMPPLRVPSSIGAFAAESEVGAPRDPFASTNTTPAWQQPPSGPGAGARRRGDPFADSAVDPFASGPDYAQGPLVTPPGPLTPAGGYPVPQSTVFPTLHPAQPAPPAPAPAPVDANRARRAFADTNADDAFAPPAPAPAGGRASLRLSDLHESTDAPDAPPPSGRDIARLVEGYDDLDTILGDGRALTPDPSRQRPKATPAGLDGMKPSEMRTRPIDTEAMNRLLLEEEQRRGGSGSAQRAPLARAAGGPAAGGRAAGPGGSSAQARPVPGPGPQALGAALGPGSGLGPAADDPSTSVRPPGAMDLQTLAFERSRLEYENRTLKAALEAARAGNPAAVKAAADALRDQEMSRLARRVAELERELVALRGEVVERQAELDRVTDEMIEKEDRIATLEDQVQQARRGAGRAVPQGLGESDDDLKF